ncbi:IDEAL domain-containing protein [Paenibacillus filicis]|uniref:IDEAL domain-containing protein n=1 Tax=Paenibacillus filicis TaxID=669464 RepID=A0ABU9DUZ5_9BACL
MTQANQYEAVYEGDWVSGSSAADEKFIGYVESFNEHGAVLVRVTQSDHEEIVNTSIEASRIKIKKLPERSPSTREELLGLIDLALMTHDKEWFENLELKLAAENLAKQSSIAASRKNTPPGWVKLKGQRNRLI